MLGSCSSAVSAAAGLYYDATLGHVHGQGSCLTAAWDAHPPPPPAPPAPPVEIFFRGRYNVEGVVGTLMANNGFGAATDVVIGGCSSGGVAVFSNADHIHSLLPPRARIAATANSGYYLNVNTESWTKPVSIMANLTGTLSVRPPGTQAQDTSLVVWYELVS